MSNLAKQAVLRCSCCGGGTCECPSGSPWTAGRAATVKLKAVFAGITSETPSIPWGAIHGVEGVDWYGVNALPPEPDWTCGGENPPTEETVCAYRNELYNEGSAWVLHDTTIPEFFSAARAIGSVACTWWIDEVFDGAFWAQPDFGTIVDGSTNSDVSIAIYYDEAEDETRIEILGRSFASVFVEYEQHIREPFTPRCDRIDGGTQTVTVFHGNSLEYQRGIAWVWFSHQSTISGKLCPNASYTFENQGVPGGHDPRYVDDQCGLKFGGAIQICGGGTCTISLVDA